MKKEFSLKQIKIKFKNFILKSHTIHVWLFYLVPNNCKLIKINILAFTDYKIEVLKPEF